MRRFFLQGIFMLLCFVTVTAQTNHIEIGQVVPGLKLNVRLGGSVKEISFNELKGKLVILDFWNVHCLACIRAFPKLDSLQKLFGPAIQIILVTRDRDQQINELLLRTKKKLPNLPCVTGDSLLNKLFPHEGEPFHVWIGRDGKVKYKTADYNTSKENIQTALSGKEVPLSNLEFSQDFDYRKTLGEQQGGLSGLVASYSILIRGLHRIERNTVVRMQRDSNSGKVRMITAINVPVVALFNIAFNHSVYGYDIGSFNSKQNHRVVYEVDSSDLFVPENAKQIDAWKNKNVASYELKIPEDASYAIYSVMQDELNRFFDIEGKIEKRKLRCLVLVDSLHKETGTRGGKATAENIENGLLTRNQTVEAFIEELQFRHYDLNTPIISDVAMTKKVEMSARCDLGDLGAVKKELNKYGLTLVEEEREINVLVLRKKK